MCVCVRTVISCCCYYHRAVIATDETAQTNHQRAGRETTLNFPAKLQVSEALPLVAAKLAKKGVARRQCHFFSLALSKLCFKRRLLKLEEAIKTYGGNDMFLSS